MAISVVGVIVIAQDEYSLVDAIKSKKITKPVVAWVSGTCATLFKSEVQFGHAGAKSGGQLESAQAKNAALRDAGAIVPNSFEEFEASIKATYDALVEQGVVTPAADVPAKQLPMDIAAAKKAGKVVACTEAALRLHVHHRCECRPASSAPSPTTAVTSRRTTAWP